MAGIKLNLDQLEFAEFGKGDRFHAERAPVSDRVGAEKLGYAVIRLAPGKRAWPYHSHHVIEEFFYVIDGEGTLRHAGDEMPIRRGDFICSPADPGQAHQIVNTSDAPLTYIALSNVEQTDVMLYPDSEKFGVFHSKTGRPRDAGAFLTFVRQTSAVDYWDGEED